MQPRHALVAQLVALSSILLVAESGGCAAGTSDDNAPTGPVATASDTGTGSTSTHAAATSSTMSGGSTSSAGGAGTTSTSSTTTTSTATSTSSTTTTSAATSTSSTTSTSAATTTSSTTTSGNGGAGGCGTVYDHTIAIDGSNDFTASETFTTTSNGYTGYVTWDATNVYVGIKGPDVTSGDANKWVLVYIGGAAGTTNGELYDTQQPTLPFSAKYHVRWKANNLYTNAEAWNGSAWADAAWDFTGKVFKQGDYLEIAIPRSNIGSPITTVDIHLSMINETMNAEGTYAGVPSTSFVDGVDKNYTHYFSFDLAGCTAPTSHPPL